MTIRQLLPITLLAACTHLHASSAAPRTDYFEGTTTLTLPDGRTLPGGAVLAWRTADPASATIVEQVISADPRPGRPPREHVVTTAVSGTRFTMTEAAGAFVGEGTLEGQAWRW